MAWLDSRVGTDGARLPQRQAQGNSISFCQCIDNVYQKLQELEVQILDSPTFYTEYSQGYYTVFWQDLNGFKMEFMCYEKVKETPV